MIPFTFCDIDFLAYLYDSKVEIYQRSPEGLEIFLGYAGDMTQAIGDKACKVVAKELFLGKASHVAPAIKDKACRGVAEELLKLSVK